MRIHQLVAGVAVAALIPTLALAQQSCEQRQSNRAVGTLAGAGLGALLGSAVAGHGDRTAGAVIGGVGGAVVGNQLSKSGADCAHAYGYYDGAGAWHASTVSKSSARGYFDREGRWVDGAPNGHYDRSGTWVRTSTDTAAAGYYDNGGRWVPASANGYYSADGRWVGGSASGHYDRSGRWVASPTTGRYDARGRWIAGPPARVTETQPGYWNQGRWQAGEVSGYYDGQGRWVATDHGNGGHGRGMPDDVAGRQAWLDQRIHRGLDDGSLTQGEGNRALRSLASINRDERALRSRTGTLRPNDERMILARLDTLGDDVREMRRGPVY